MMGSGSLSYASSSSSAELLDSLPSSSDLLSLDGRLCDERPIPDSGLLEELKDEVRGRDANADQYVAIG